MTTSEVIEYYAGLLIMQYRNKTRAKATIEALVKMPVMDQLPLQVQDAFDLETAIGVQLDVLGKYMGVTRMVSAPGQTITLDDDDFRSLIKIAIIRNSAGSSLATIQDLLHTYFDGAIFVFDYANMRMSYYVDSDAGSIDLVLAFIIEGLLPRPMGVELSSVIYAPIIDTFFGCVSYKLPTAVNNSPLNSYTAYEMDRPFLSYKNAIQI